MEPKEIINNIEEKIKELEEYSSRTMGMIKYKDMPRMKEEHEEMIKILYSAIEVFEMWPIGYDVSESAKTKKIKLSEVRKLVRKSLNENIDKNYTHFLVDKNTNKIVNGWDYSQTDPYDIKDFVKMDIIDQFPDRKPSEFKLLTILGLKKSGINPFDTKNWNDFKESITEDKNPCWDGYKQLGTKMKNGKEVPNCIKEEDCNECDDKKIEETKIIKLSEIRELVKKSLKESKQGYETYHDSFTSAAEAAREMVENRGYTIDEDDWQTQVALGGRYGRSRPAIGKSHTFTVGLVKDGKPQRKALTFTVYGMESGKYELVAYVN
jgi:hypothetical protein